MLTITVQVDAPLGAAQSVKEVLAMAMEAVGITRVVEIRESQVEQVSLWESTPANRPSKGDRRSFLETMLGLYSSGVLVDPEQEHIYRAELEALRKERKDNDNQARRIQR